MNPKQPTPEPAPTTPTPNPAPQSVVMHDHTGALPPNPGGGGGKRGLKYLLMFVVAVLLVGGGYWAYTKLSAKPATKQAAVNAKKDIAHLNYGILNNDTNSFYPNFNVTDPNFTIQSQIFEGLVKYSEQTKVVPNLATSWTNPTTSTWDFELKKNVSFHTGRTMTASDVVASFDAAKKNTDLWEVYGSTISSVKALSDTKVEITTEQPDPFLLNKLARIYVIDPKETADPIAAGTGPYQLKPGTKAGDDKVELAAFDKYHGGHIYTRELTIINLKDEAAMVKGLNDGTLDLAGEFNNDQPSGLNVDALQALRIQDRSVTMLIPNTTAKGPLQKLQVRQALQVALDIPSLIKAGGLLATPASQAITKSIPGYNSSLTTPTRDVAKAKQLLAAAGYPNGVTLTLNSTPTYDALLAEMGKQLKEVGITLVTKPVGSLNDLVQNYQKGKNELTLLSYGSDVLDGSDVFSTVFSSAAYKSDQMDKDLTDAAATLDQAQRLKLLQDTSKILHDDVAVVPLFSRERTWFTKKGYVLPEDDLTLSTGTYFWQAYQE